MPSLYAPMSGVNTKQKSVWGLMSGVNTKMKNGYGLMSGVNTKIFDSGVLAVYSNTIKSGDSGFTINYSVGPTGLTCTSRLVTVNTSGVHGDGWISFLLNFSNSLTFNAGELNPVSTQPLAITASGIAGRGCTGSAAAYFSHSNSGDDLHPIHNHSAASMSTAIPYTNYYTNANINTSPPTTTDTTSYLYLRVHLSMSMAYTNSDTTFSLLRLIAPQICLSPSNYIIAHIKI